MPPEYSRSYWCSQYWINKTLLSRATTSFTLLVSELPLVYHSQLLDRCCLLLATKTPSDPKCKLPLYSVRSSSGRCWCDWSRLKGGCPSVLVTPLLYSPWQVERISQAMPRLAVFLQLLNHWIISFRNDNWLISPLMVKIFLYCAN